MKMRMTALLLCILMFYAESVQTCAAELEADAFAVSCVVAPHMDYIAQANVTLRINSDGNATVECNVTGYQGIITSVEITADLQQYVDDKWVTIETFTVAKNSYRVSLNETYDVSKGYSYRVKASVKAYSESTVETRNVTSSEVKY